MAKMHGWNRDWIPVNTVLSGQSAGLNRSALDGPDKTTLITDRMAMTSQ